MNKLPLIMFCVALSFALVAINYAMNVDLRKVQSGELTLVCVMKDEARTIAPSQVTGLMDDTWIFSNGHAKNCIVKPAD